MTGMACIITLPPPWLKRRRGFDNRNVRKAIEEHLRSNQMPYRVTGLRGEWPLHRKPKRYAYSFTIDLGMNFNFSKEGKKALMQIKGLFPQAKCQICISSEVDCHWAIEVELRCTV